MADFYVRVRRNMKRKTIIIIMMMIVKVLSSNSAAAAADRRQEEQEVVKVKGCPFNAVYNFGGFPSAALHPHHDLSVIDHFASAFHLPSPNPYYMKNGIAAAAASAHYHYGADFAVDGATALSASFINQRMGLDTTVSTNSLGVQLQDFMTLLDSGCSSRHDCAHKLKKAIFFVGDIASNDYNLAFFPANKPMEEAVYLVPLVVRSIKDTLTRLIAAGAVNLIVSGTLPSGCQPSYLNAFPSDDPMSYDSMKCLRSFNTFSRLHNDHLRQELSDLRSQHPEVHIVYADSYNAFMTILHNPDILGFDRSSSMKACCTATVTGSSTSGGIHNGGFYYESKTCGGQGATVCSDPKKFIHWDGFHLTQEAHKYAVEGFISGSFVHPKLTLPERWKCLM